MPSMPEPAIALSQDRHLTLVVPGLAYAAADKQFNGNLQRLEWLLGRADKSVDPLDSVEASLFQSFGVEIKPGQDVPVAAVTRVLDMGVVDNAWWIRADPVHLAPHGDSLILSGGDGLVISQEEADQLVVEILDVFLADGWVLKAPRPDRWYLQLVEVPDMQTTPVANVAGRDISPALPTGKEGKQWHTVLNELQIMLHTSAVNVEREAKGLPAINGLWLWGGGRLPTLKENNWVKYWGQDAVGTALARLSEVALSGRPASGENWLREAEAGKHLVMLDQASLARLGGQAEALQDFVDTFDEQWIEPLINALRTKELSGLTIVLDGGISFRADANGLGRWWRRRARISSLGRT
ncbi:MAG: hypothetical protein BMS9Abin15_1105 [Gammaproteobacteria bacterium]|nr:MAG: hypothetical protein BMS9Abin15_1105 [Gammaproteobacteria bacterium]